MNETIRAFQDASNKCDGAIQEFKNDLKSILQLRMEELYGGGHDSPKCNEDNEEAIIEIWDNAVTSCIKIVKEL